MKIHNFAVIFLLLIVSQSSGVLGQDVSDLFQKKQYAAVLKVIDPVIEKNKNESGPFANEINADLFYTRGSSRIEVVYSARTGTEYGSLSAIAPQRSSFEIEYPDDAKKMIELAIADLDKAMSFFSRIDWGQRGKGYALEQNILKYRALAKLEKAQYVTNDQADFLASYTDFTDLDGSNFQQNFQYMKPEDSWKKDGYLLTAHLRSIVGKGNTKEAYEFLSKWKLEQPIGNTLTRDSAVTSMVNALDMIGNFNQSRALIIAKTISQIQQDGGKFVPANQVASKAIFKSHLYNVGYAAQIPVSENTLPLKRARIAGALSLKDVTTPAEEVIIKAAAEKISAGKQIAPLDTKLFSIRAKLRSDNKREKESAMKLLTEIEKTEARNAAVLSVRGYASFQKGDFAVAEKELNSAIAADPFLAFANDANQTLAAVYQKLGKADLAAKEQQTAARLQQVIAILAAP